MGAGDWKQMLAARWYVYISNLPFDDHGWCCSPSMVISWGCGSVHCWRQVVLLLNYEQI